MSDEEKISLVEEFQRLCDMNYAAKTTAEQQRAWGARDAFIDKNRDHIARALRRDEAIQNQPPALIARLMVLSQSIEKFHVEYVLRAFRHLTRDTFDPAFRKADQ